MNAECGQETNSSGINFIPSVQICWWGGGKKVKSTQAAVFETFATISCDVKAMTSVKNSEAPTPSEALWIVYECSNYLEM